MKATSTRKRLLNASDTDSSARLQLHDAMQARPARLGLAGASQGAPGHLVHRVTSLKVASDDQKLAAINQLLLLPTACSIYACLM